MMSQQMLRVENVNKHYGKNKVLDNVSLQIGAGETLGFLGPNGAGKTTLIRIILGLVYADSGSITINGYPLRGQFRQAIRGVGAVVETPRFYDYLNARQNLRLACNLHPGSAGRMDEVLEMVGLSGRWKDKVGTYSLGMRQRLGLARALVTSPEIVFLDEPMNGLDPQGIIESRALIRSLQRDHGITFFITSHLLREVEQVCDRVAIIREGKIVAQGELEKMLARDVEVVDVVTDQPERALSLLNNVSFVRELTMEQDRLTAVIDQGRSAELNRLLWEKNMAVRYLVPKKTSLEELFIELTQGDGHERITD
jgi:ABC-type multidrug transport system ATPase subunit